MTNFNETIYGTLSSSFLYTAKILKDLGYRQVSRHYRSIARVDISLKAMVAFFIRDNFGNSTSGLPCMSIDSQKDQYRRCHSQDWISDVPEKIMEQLR